MEENNYYLGDSALAIAQRNTTGLEEIVSHQRLDGNTPIYNGDERKSKSTITKLDKKEEQNTSQEKKVGDHHHI